MIPARGRVRMRRPPVVALLLLFAATTAAAQSPMNDWSPVRQLLPGQPVRVLTDAAILQAGTLGSVTEDSITLIVGGQDQRLARAAIREVSVERRSRKRNVWWGLAIGAAASFAAVGLSCAGESEGCSESAPAWFYPLAGAGALTGALMPPRTVWRGVYVRVP
jgi:hypothetical protein